MRKSSSRRPFKDYAEEPSCEMKSPRYTVVNESQSCHCCFKYTVVDTNDPVILNGKHYNNRYEPMCETFTKEDAELICAALNNHDLKRNG